MINKTDKEKRSLKWVVNIKDTILVDKRMVLVFMNGRMEAYIKVIGNRILLMDMESINGKMEDRIQEIGSKIYFMGSDYIFGKMGEVTKDHMLEVKRKVMVYIKWQMGRFMMDIGRMDYSMEKVNYSIY
jgi:hypothetical protein